MRIFKRKQIQILINNSEKKIKFFATHDSNFAEKYCNKLFIMKKGTLKVYNDIKEGLDYFRNHYYQDNNRKTSKFIYFSKSLYRYIFENKLDFKNLR